MPKFTDAQVAVALRGRRAVKRYPFPTLEGVDVGVRMLSDDTMDTIRLQAAEFCKARKVDLALDPEFFDRVIHRHIIWHAFVDAENEVERFFPTLDEVISLDPMLVRTLYELFMAHQQAADPLSFVSEEEVDVLVEQLGKSEAAAARLSLFDRRTLLSFVLSMAKLRQER